MKRWNGWGDETVEYLIPPALESLVQTQIGLGIPPQDIPFARVVASVPPSRLPTYPLISYDAAERVRHARG